MANKIFIDGLGLVEGHFSGVGQYILGIIEGMDQVLEDCKNNNKTTHQIFVIIPKDKVDRFKEFGFKNIYYKAYPLPFRYMAALWHRNLIPPLNFLYGRGLYVFPRFVDMRLAFKGSAALVIFDLSFELHKEYSDEGNANFLSKGVRRSINKTNKVITISENAKSEIIKFYNLNEDKVAVATPAADPSLFYRRSNSEIKNVKYKYGIQGDYILALSNLEPRKNLELLINAYCRLPKSVTKSLSLVLVGVNGWKTDKLFKQIIDRVEEGYNIVRPSEYVVDKDKPAIISGAKMLVYPSHYEGFGMPPLEALACGTPIITADNSSLPEVVGEVGKMIDSNNEDELLKSIEYYLHNIDEISANALIEGPKQAEKFSWKNSAQIFFEALGIKI